MISETRTANVLYENLDTSFVNLWALLRYLSQRSFVGRVHVKLENYSADVFLNGREIPLVHEVDRENGTDVVEEAALHRLVLRARESSGSITVYEGAEESTPAFAEKGLRSAQLPIKVPPVVEPEAATPEAMRSSAGKDDEPETFTLGGAANEPRPVDGAQPRETIRIAGDLISAVEHAAASLGADFTPFFWEARISLADDYPFLDPLTGQLRYENSSLTLDGETAPQGLVTAITETLRRVVDKIAAGEKARRTRERVALELARVARKKPDALARSGLKEQLDRIAGTKVI